MKINWNLLGDKKYLEKILKPKKRKKNESKNKKSSSRRKNAKIR